MILVTGATGFIGRTLVRDLLAHGFEVTASVRRTNTKIPSEVQQVSTGDLQADTDWAEALLNVDVVVHLAARTHVLRDSATDPLTEFRKTNTDGVLNLARQSAAAGVRRFIFISSIHVNGNKTEMRPFTPEDVPNPVEPYAISKMEAEAGLNQIASHSAMEVVIIRPPLVYGPGAPGNFGRLIRAVARGMPLPLGAIHNQRSLVALDNLVDLIRVSIEHPGAANQVLLVSDGEDLSTTELLQRVARALERPARLLPVSQRLMVAGLGLLGKQALAQRLCGSLQVDISKTCELLGWSPPVDIDTALAATARAYVAQDKSDDE